MTDVLDLITADRRQQASDLESVDTEGVRTVAEIARRVQRQQIEVARLEDEGKQSKEDLRKLTDEDLPSMLHELGVQSFTLDDGSKVDVKPTYGGHISVAHRAAAHEWLRDNGFDDIIKNQVTCTFGRGEDDQAASFIEMAVSSGHAPIQKAAVHPSTLTAFVKEQIEAGKDIPQDLFGVYTGHHATIKRGK